MSNDTVEQTPLRHTVLADGLLFPEGPLVDRAGNVWCVELRGGALCRISPEGQIERHVVGGAPNGLALDAQGDIWYCDSDHNEIRRFEMATARVHSVVGSVDGHDLDRPNDLAFDAAGNLLFTCPGSSRQEPTGYVCCLSASGVVTVIATELLFPNGLAFTADGTRLYLAETYRTHVSSASWNASSPHALSVQPCFDTPGPIGPDGLAIDRQGRVHACLYSAGVVLIADAGGSVLRSVPVPGGRPTNCAFDPLGRYGLLVTEAAKGTVLSFPDLGPGDAPFLGQRPHASPKFPPSLTVVKPAAK
ncbi:SMP-30/gluconolactonase/LRE family protein [Steroidobacter sp.]|uniref:SMP-30/gluconolactonase/LRE family protein n=1 Tax=Steroidobacter sp. TaxID=1978227 RepID=UPI001A40BE41|nr:SMP-30/gluconolactonase/LRE family protein [Steroidobacter sp.]MBL8271901.1 SMP-30/gluconolactonase/LRE family protein [Steroidobacter sp.]